MINIAKLYWPKIKKHNRVKILSVDKEIKRE